MVMDMLRVVHRPDPQYSADSFREAKYSRLGYGTRLPRDSHSATQDPRQKNNQVTKVGHRYLKQACPRQSCTTQTRSGIEKKQPTT
jgi:hypothetical protein